MSVGPGKVGQCWFTTQKEVVEEILSGNNQTTKAVAQREPQ